MTRIAIPARVLEEAGCKGWGLCNPSVTMHLGKLWCVVRAVNYSMTGGIFTRPAGGSARTVNFIARLDPVTFEPVGMGHADGRGGWKVMESRDPGSRIECHAMGYEDVRLFSLGGQLAGSATISDRIGRAEIVMLQIDGSGDIVRAIPQPSAAVTEKNWMPVVRADQVAWIYSVHPTIVRGREALEPLADHGACPMVAGEKGGSQLLGLGRGLGLGHVGYLAVTHATWEGRTRTYQHRFVQLDADLRIVRASERWSFRGHSIEFCAGMTRPSAGKLLLSFGVDDAQAWLVEIDEEDLSGLLWTEADGGSDADARGLSGSENETGSKNETSETRETDKTG